MKPFHVTVLGLASIAAPALPAQSSFSEVLVPIHAQLDDPDGLRDGIWAAGPDYKVRFHTNGIEYFPALGSAYPHNLPLRWRTSSIRIGDRELATTKATAVRASDYRYEYRSPHVVEAYDVRIDGVEQTFRIDIDKTLLPRGDLILRGDVTTALTGHRSQHRHGTLSFRDSNQREVLRYGAAIAIDAEGRRFAMTTSFDGENIELRLDANDVAAAAFPLLVDPLIGNDSNREAGTTAVASVTNLGQSVVVNVYTRVTSSTDHDVFAIVTDLDLNITALVWADTSTSYSSKEVAAGGMDRRGRFVIAAERRRLGRTDLFLYTQSIANLTFNSGSSTVRVASSGEFYRNPEVGGSHSGDEALVVYDHTTSAFGYEIEGLRFDVANNTTRSLSQDIAPFTFGGERIPSVTPYGPEWVVSWISRLNTSSDVLARKVFSDGSLNSTAQIIQPASNNVYEGVKIAGERGQFVATYSQTPSGIGVTAVRARRFDWSGAIPNLIALTTLSSGGSGYRNGDIAFDPRTGSHWIATFQRDIGLFGRRVEAARLGDVGAVIEVRDVHGSSNDQPFSPSIAVSNETPANTFPILYATSATPSNSVLGEVFEYPSECFVHSSYGSSCGFRSEFSSPTIAGSSEFDLALQVGTSFTGLAACVISPLQSALPLDSIGMTGCNLLVEPALGVAVPATIQSDLARVTISLGGASPFTGFFNSQWVYSDGANALGVVTNRGSSHESR